MAHADRDMKGESGEHRVFRQYLMERAHVPESEFERMIPFLRVRTFPKGERLLSKGKVNQHIYFVQKGLLRYYSIDAKGREHILQFAPENWWVSDRHNLSTQVPSELFIDAHEPTSVVLLDQTFIEHASEISEAFRSYQQNILMRHIQQLYHRIHMLIGHTAMERYQEFLATYPDLTQRVPQWMIASYLGLTPEGLSRIRRERVKK